MERLNLKGPATEDARCLACHTNPALALGDLHDSRLASLRAEGVSCEACHGNAGDYLHEHTRWTNASRSGGHAASGMTFLNHVAECATVCMGCHVGAPAGEGRATRDMNHDMIAAGHPRLNFDFAEYLRRLPRHWQDRERAVAGDHPRTSEFEARVWYTGRIAHAEAACNLLADRIKRSQSDPRSTWPEFAEFNCAACHHTVPNEEMQKASELGKRPPGALPWQSIWPLTESSLASQTEPAQAALASLLKLLEKPRIPRGEAVAGPAKTAAESLAKLKANLDHLPDREFANLVMGFFKRVDVATLDPDELGQVIQGLAAVERSHGKTPDPNLLAKFDDAFGLLRRQNWQKSRVEMKALLGTLAP